MQEPNEIIKESPPKVIYLQWNVPPDPEFGVTWCRDKLNDNDVEYVPTANAKRLEAALKQSLDAMIWSTGSGDFTPEGLAYQGYLKVLEPAIEAAKQALFECTIMKGLG